MQKEAACGKQLTRERDARAFQDEKQRAVLMEWICDRTQARVNLVFGLCKNAITKHNHGKPERERERETRRTLPVWQRGLRRVAVGKSRA